jgi:hypothetical protein
LHLKFIFLQISHLKNEIKLPTKCLTVLNLFANHKVMAWNA